jgi:hypothetical protein
LRNFSFPTVLKAYIDSVSVAGGKHLSTLSRMLLLIVGRMMCGPDFCVHTEEGEIPNFETINGIQIAFTDELAMDSYVDLHSQ